MFGHDDAYEHVCIFMRLNPYIYTYIYLSISINIYTYIYVCMYRYIHTYIYIYIYAHTKHKEHGGSHGGKRNQMTRQCVDHYLYVFSFYVFVH